MLRVGRVGLLGAHLVGEAIGGHERRHLRAAAQLVDELLVEPGLVDPQARIGQQAVAVEALDVVALVGAAVAPDVDAVLLHRRDQHRAGDGAAERRGVEVGDAAGRDVEGAGLDGGDAFVDQLRAAIDQPGFFGAVLQRLARDLVVVGLVGLAEVGGVGKGIAPFCFIQCSAALVSRPPEKAMPTMNSAFRMLLAAMMRARWLGCERSWISAYIGTL
jgi:hypothetical protein